MLGSVHYSKYPHSTDIDNISSDQSFSKGGRDNTINKRVILFGVHVCRYLLVFQNPFYSAEYSGSLGKRVEMRESVKHSERTRTHQLDRVPAQILCFGLDLMKTHSFSFADLFLQFFKFIHNSVIF